MFTVGILVIATFLRAERSKDITVKAVNLFFPRKPDPVEQKI
jgi:hypothetical protein